MFFKTLIQFIYKKYYSYFKLHEVGSIFDSEDMIESIKLLDQELIEIKNAAAAATLKPLPGETVIIFKIF